MCVAFCLAGGAFLGFGGVVVDVGEVGPEGGGIPVVGGGGVRAGGPGWKRGRREEAEGDVKEFWEDDYVGLVRVVIAILVVIAVIVAVIVVVIAILVIAVIAVIVVVLAVLAVLVLAIGLGLGLGPVMERSDLVGERLERPDRFVAPHLSDLGLDQGLEVGHGWIGRVERVGNVPDEKIGMGVGIVFGFRVEDVTIVGGREVRGRVVGDVVGDTWRRGAGLSETEARSEGVEKGRVVVGDGSARLCREHDELEFVGR